MEHQKSIALYERALKALPGGVNSPVRAFKAVGGTPLFMTQAQGAHVWDADDNRYIDYVGSWGPFILGHGHPAVVEAIHNQAYIATSFGAPTELELEVAEFIQQAMPSIERVRMVSSGTEATMSAIRLARGYTQRDKIIKFEGGYHGHSDSFLIKAGSGALTLGTPNTPGVTKGTALDTLNARFNDIASVESLIDANRDEIAAIIIEPVAGNMGVIPATKEFLLALRQICDAKDIVLIFDEVMSGFRVALGGAQSLYGIKPDLTTLGKIVGGGLPVGAFGGKRDIMSMVSPSGPIYQAGTLSGNSLAMAAGLATLKILRDENPYATLEKHSAALEVGTAANLHVSGIKATQNRVGSMSTLFFTPDPVTDYESATKSDTERYAKYFQAMIEEGVYLAPSQFEAMFLSITHNDEVIAQTLEAQLKSFAKIMA